MGPLVRDVSRRRRGRDKNHAGTKEEDARRQLISLVGPIWCSLCEHIHYAQGTSERPTWVKPAHRLRCGECPHFHRYPPPPEPTVLSANGSFRGTLPVKGMELEVA